VKIRLEQKGWVIVEEREHPYQGIFLKSKGRAKKGKEYSTRGHERGESAKADKGKGGNLLV